MSERIPVLLGSDGLYHIYGRVHSTDNRPIPPPEVAERNSPAYFRRSYTPNKFRETFSPESVEIFDESLKCTTNIVSNVSDEEIQVELREQAQEFKKSEPRVARSTDLIEKDKYSIISLIFSQYTNIFKAHKKARDRMLMNLLGFIDGLILTTKETLFGELLKNIRDQIFNNSQFRNGGE